MKQNSFDHLCADKEEERGDRSVFLKSNTKFYAEIANS
jgi:hypothetical protein